MVKEKENTVQIYLEIKMIELLFKKRGGSIGVRVRVSLFGYFESYI